MGGDLPSSESKVSITILISQKTMIWAISQISQKLVKNYIFCRFQNDPEITQKLKKYKQYKQNTKQHRFAVHLGILIVMFVFCL